MRLVFSKDRASVTATGALLIVGTSALVLWLLGAAATQRSAQPLPSQPPSSLKTSAPSLEVVPVARPLQVQRQETSAHRPAVTRADNGNGSRADISKQKAPAYNEEGHRSSQAAISLGERLFFDTILSRNRNVSCGTCHLPELGWSNGQRFAKGTGGAETSRNVPTVVNASMARTLFWDGRATTLIRQVVQPIEHPDEMDLDLEELVARLEHDASYARAFDEDYDGVPTPDRIAQALTEYVRTLASGETPFDRYRRGDRSALSPAARRGHDVFFFRANCSTCHRPPMFTDHAFHNIGIGMDESPIDKGREVVTGNRLQRGAFRTPSLRDIHRTSPYMHDGRFATLREVVDYYSQGAIMNPFLDELMNIMPLSESEKDDLVQFLKEGLSSDAYPTGPTNATARR